jgi:hypothetical protein
VTGRRELVTAVGAVVVAGLAVVFASGRTWVQLSAARPAPFPAVTRTVGGRTEFPALNGLAIAALLVGVLLLITGRWVRHFLGVLVVVFGLIIGNYGARGLGTPSPARRLALIDAPTVVDGSIVSADPSTVWPVVTVIAAVLMAASGVMVLVRAGRWTGGLAARYEAPSVRATAADPWQLLDRGDDPTIGDV